MAPLLPKPSQSSAEPGGAGPHVTYQHLRAISAGVTGSTLVLPAEVTFWISLAQGEEGQIIPSCPWDHLTRKHRYCPEILGISAEKGFWQMLFASLGFLTRPAFFLKGLLVL